MRLFRVALFVVAGWGVAAPSYGQPVPLRRSQQALNEVFATTRQDARAGISSDFFNDTMSGEILVNVGGAASAFDSEPPGSASAQVIAMSQAMDLTPLGSTTFVPTVNATSSFSTVLTASNPGTALATTNDTFFDTNSRVRSRYVLDDTISGYLHGSIYLVGITSGLAVGDAAYNAFARVSASINGRRVSAQYNPLTELWDVDVDLPGLTENFSTSGVNNFFTFTVPFSATGGASGIELRASTFTASSAEASSLNGESDASVQGQDSLSASAWITFTQTIEPPPTGDFDGDGDVDGADFLSFQRGFGESSGATLSQGDANQDGNVDGTDLALWAGSFGTTSSLPIATSSTVPEPTSSAMAMTAILFFVFSRRNKKGAKQR